MTIMINIKYICEAILMAASEPLSIEKIMTLFSEENKPDKEEIKKALNDLVQDYQQRAIELKKTASGYRFQVRRQYSDWIYNLLKEKPTKYSRALLETLAIIAYRQPVTRADIEDIRGVAVSSSMIKTLQERSWIRIVGHRDIPGKPAIYATTREFLDYFNLKSLDELPSLQDVKSIDDLVNTIDKKLELETNSDDIIQSNEIGIEVI
jgi:segregation and condensation protein B